MRRPPLAWLAAGASALLAATAVSAAEAQLGDPGEQTGVDTAYTPRAKSAPQDPRAGESAWRYVAGARYEGNPKPSDVPAGAATPFELDFFDVAFFDEDHGFAGGAECAQRVDRADGGAPAAPDRAETAAGAGWALPLVVSSTVGGEFAEAGGQGGGGAGDGFWRGCQVVRLDVSGDPKKDDRRAAPRVRLGGDRCPGAEAQAGTADDAPGLRPRGVRPGHRDPPPRHHLFRAMNMRAR